MAAGTVNYEQGSVEAGLANGARLLDTDPAAAALQAEVLLKVAPHDTAAHRLHARALAALDRTEDAREARAKAVRFSRTVEPLANAHRAITEGRLKDADALLRPHLATYPDDPVALSLRGKALAQAGKKTAAVRSFEAALAFMPEYADARVGLVTIHQHFFDQAAALAALEPLLADRPDDVNLLRWKASLLSKLDEHTAAANILQRLTDATPGEAGIWISLGDERRTLGQREAAHAAYRRSVELQPTLGNGWWGLAALGHTFDAADRAQMKTALDEVGRDDTGRPHLNFALAIALEQAGDRAGAFGHFAAGNAIREAAEPFESAATAREVEQSRRLLIREFFAAHANTGCLAPDPIFIVGMPRSGSTLLEQILSCHSQIEGTAELPIVPVLINTMAAERGLDPRTPYRELLAGLSTGELAALGEEYLRLAAPHRKTGKPYFLDKLPHNWADVGFIKLILPNAKIIDMRRRPMDCCWSNFRMLFARGHPSSNSLEGMAAFYRHYIAMMAHWDEVMPGAVHRMIYERLIDDFEAEVRRVVEYLGLPFEPALLEFHKQDRAVATASAEQVRRPLNREGVGAWRAYKPWLGPLEAAVGDLERTYAD